MLYADGAFKLTNGEGANGLKSPRSLVNAKRVRYAQSERRSSERQGEIPGPKRNRRERTDEWASVEQWTLWPEQELHEQIRLLVLFHETVGERAKEIDVPARTLARKADEFEKYGMQSLFSSGEQGGVSETSKTLPQEARQLIVDLHAELPTMSWREIAEVCYIRTGRRPDHKNVKRIATSGSPPSLTTRRYQLWHVIPDPAERKLAVLSSAMSASQTRWDYLAVLADAIRRYGAPEALVTDGGGQFYATVALQLYDMLGIRKERIAPGAPWQNYAETLFSIQKRLADHAFSNARTWAEIELAHQAWWKNYNSEHHYAHRERQDGRHSPYAVLRGALGHFVHEEVLARALYATQFTRQIDKYGYIKLKHWKFFGENGLAGEEVSVWGYEDTVKVEHQATTLSLYSVHLSPDQRRITEVKNARHWRRIFVVPN
jgi:hypothetical protein